MSKLVIGRGTNLGHYLDTYMEPFPDENTVRSVCRCGTTFVSTSWEHALSFWANHISFLPLPKEWHQSMIQDLLLECGCEVHVVAPTLARVVENHHGTVVHCYKHRNSRTKFHPVVDGNGFPAWEMGASA